MGNRYVIKRHGGVICQRVYSAKKNPRFSSKSHITCLRFLLFDYPSVIVILRNSSKHIIGQKSRDEWLPDKEFRILLEKNMCYISSIYRLCAFSNIQFPERSNTLKESFLCHMNNHPPSLMIPILWQNVSLNISLYHIFPVAMTESILECANIDSNSLRINGSILFLLFLDGIMLKKK